MSDYFDRIERQLVGRIDSGARSEQPPVTARLIAVWPSPRALGRHARALVPAVAVLLVVAVGAVFLTARGGSPHPGGSGGVLGTDVSFTATPTEPGQSLSAVVARSLPILRARLHAAFPHTRFRVSARADTVTVSLPGATISGGLRRQIATLAAIGRLYIYDWEDSVLTSGGRPAAAGLARQDPSALRVSEGDAGSAPGEVGAGGVSAVRALALASRQSSVGTGPPHYYALSAGCAAAAKRASDCELVGPALDPAALAAVPAGVGLSRPVRVPAGVTLVRAADAAAGSPASSPQFYVLRGEPALNSTRIIDPAPGTDQSGSPDLTFRFTAIGAQHFQHLTAAVAHRGAHVSSLGQTLDQHVAVVLDGQLLSVLSVDFRTYPDGIKTRSADVSGGFTPTSARDLAIVVRYGPLPAQLTR